ncbi:tetratricopeptide repeat protein [Alteraurantiacibacter palmitatis]|uniref:Tetratricopeptide repeat protein n=1 Tax=Alteraurantiacibacter palmitatis TaxID=2054628 RepID=A0ABV7E512_9SPHN
MLLGTIMGVLMVSQGSAMAMVEEIRRADQREVAYEELSQGDARAAVAALEALRADNPNDPALLINLGAAYQTLGDLVRAEQAYRAAAGSEIRYQLELADGSWVDSRRAARSALRALEQSRLAMN